MQSTRTTIILLIIGVLISSPVLSQELLESYRPTEFMEAGNAFINDNQDYEKAEKEFAKVHPNDTLYSRALYNRIVCSRLMGKHNKALELIEESLPLNNEYIASVYLNKIFCLDSLGKKEEAYAILNEAEEKFPYNYDLKKAKAPLLESEGKYKEALAIYKKCIRDEPLNANHHRSLAAFAIKAGGLTHAILPLAAALALNPNGDNNLFLIRRCNYIVSNKPQKEDVGYDLSIFENDFEDIDDLVKNYVALDESYQVPGLNQIPLIKQLYLMISESEESEDFFSQTYLRPFKSLLKDNKFAELAALIVLISEDENHVKYVEDNLDDLLLVNTTFKDMMDDSSEQRDAFDYLFSDNGKIVGISQYIKEKDIVIGPAVYFNEYGSIQSKGSFNDNGEMTGDWVWYHTNGKVSRESTYENGKQQGETIYYLESGTIINKVNYKNDLVEGVLENYKLIGYKYEDIDYKNDEKDGQQIGYFPDKTVNYKYTLENGKYKGPFKIYYEDGSIDREGAFSNDLYEVEVIEYYRNGQVKSKSNYQEGLLHGTSAMYYEDGQLQNKGEYKKDKKLGIWKEHTSAGFLSQVEEFDEKGKVNGPTKLLDHLGRVETVFMKKNGDITKLINYDINGEEISSYKRKGNTLKFKNLTVNGLLSSEGQFVNDLREGEWKFYDSYGDLSSIAYFKEGLQTGEEKNYRANKMLASIVNYKEGMKNGIYIDYYPNGIMQSQSNYKDDVLEGRFLSYNQEGVIMQDLYFLNGQLHGKMKYYECDGKLYLVEQFDRGYPMEGVRYAPDGTITSEFKLEKGFGIEAYYFNADQKQIMGSTEYKAGVKDGPRLRFHNNGKKRSVGAYVNDNMNGEWQSYYFNGNLEKKSQYDYGSRIGSWQEFYIDGNLQSEYQYSYGRLDGVNTFYHDNGKVSQTSPYVKGYMQGTVELFNFNGEALISLIFENDVFLGYKYLDSSEQLNEMIPITAGTGLLEGYFPNGQKSIAYNLKAGVIDGEYLTYYSNGQVEKMLTYINGLVHGKYLTYYDNGVIHSEKNYSYDDKNGEQKFYHPNGKLKRLENWVYGEQHGLTTFYDENETVTQTIRYQGNVPYEFK